MSIAARKTARQPWLASHHGDINGIARPLLEELCESCQIFSGCADQAALDMLVLERLLRLARCERGRLFRFNLTASPPWLQAAQCGWTGEESAPIDPVRFDAAFDRARTSVLPWFVMAHDAEAPEIPVSTRTRWLAWVPLRCCENLSAVALLDSDRPGLPDNQRQDAMRWLAEQAGHALLRMESQQRAERRTERMRRIERELDDFLYIVTHDLREPMRAIESFGGILRDDFAPQLGPEGREMTTTLISAVQRLRGQFDDLLRLSRIGRQGGPTVVLDMDSLMQRIVSELQPKIVARAAVVTVQKSLPAVVGDHDHVELIVSQLIDNALKFNQSRPPLITVGGHLLADGAESRQGMAQFEVHDNGIGMEPRMLQEIFAVFRRLHPRERYEGTGIGLALARKAATHLGGRLWAESTPGKGSTFFFTLPLPPPSTPMGTLGH